MELILNAEERELLQDILEQRHRALLKEISHTDSREFKQDLRKKGDAARFNIEPLAENGGSRTPRLTVRQVG